MFPHVSASHIRNVYCLNLACDPHRKNDISSYISPQSFIKVSMVRRSRLVIFTSRKNSVSAVALASCLQDGYCLKLSEDLVEKIMCPVIFDTNHSFSKMLFL